MPLNKQEAALICSFLADLSDQYGNAGCNDLTLTDTPEHRAIVQAAEEAEDGEDAEKLNIARGKIYTYDHIVVGHLQQRLMTEFDLTKKDLPKVTG